MAEKIVGISRYCQVTISRNGTVNFHGCGDISQRFGGDDTAQSAAALDDGAGEQAAGHGRCDHVLDAGGAGALSEHGDVVGVTAEAGDVALHPLQRGSLVPGAVVAAGPAGLLGEQGVAEEAEDAEAVVDGHEYHPALRPGLAVHGHLVAPAVGVGSAVDPYGHRQFPLGLASGVTGGPDVEIEAVLVEFGVALPVEFLGVERLGVGVRGLHRGGTEAVAYAHGVPGRYGLGLLPA